jgi:hypothetical protein
MGQSAILREHFLHWLESLSFIHKISNVVLSIRKLLHNVIYRMQLQLHPEY